MLSFEGVGAEPSVVGNVDPAPRMQPSQGVISDVVHGGTATRQGEGSGDSAAPLAVALAEAEQLRRGLARAKARLKERERDTTEAMMMQTDTQRLLMEQIEDSRAVQVHSSLRWTARFPAPPDLSRRHLTRDARRSAG